MDDIAQGDTDFIGLAADIVGAYVTKNNVTTSELPGLIAATHAALVKLNAPPAPAIEKPTPPIPIRKTVTPDHIISLEDGKPYKSLKRHLTTRGLTPDQYRQNAAQRSELAKSAGLGQRRRHQAEARKAEAKTQAAAPARRGRPKKADAASAE
jgi:predicted transcriptional regulator